MTALKARRITPTAVQVVEEPTIRLPEDLYHFEPRPRMIFRHAYVGDGDGDIDIYTDGTGVAPVACVRDSHVAGKGLYTCRDLAPGDLIGGTVHFYQGGLQPVQLAFQELPCLLNFDSGRLSAGGVVGVGVQHQGAAVDFALEIFEDFGAAFFPPGFGVGDLVAVIKGEGVGELY